MNGNKKQLSEETKQKRRENLEKARNKKQEMKENKKNKLVVHSDNISNLFNSESDSSGNNDNDSTSSNDSDIKTLAELKKKKNKKNNNNDEHFKKLNDSIADITNKVNKLYTIKKMKVQQKKDIQPPQPIIINTDKNNNSNDQILNVLKNKLLQQN